MPRSEKQQKDYEEQMQQVISKWGQWTSLDTPDVVMPVFSAYESDIPSAEFPERLAANKDHLWADFGLARSHRACQARYLCRIWLRFFNMTGAGLGDAVPSKTRYFQ
jgi:hypothetical protein